MNNSKALSIDVRKLQASGLIFGGEYVKMLLTFAAHQAREASVKDRSQAETGLTGALGILLESSTDFSGANEQDLIRELKDLTDKIRMAVSIHVDAVNRTQMVRKKWFIRVFRLAGHAPEPVTYEFEGDVL